MENAATSARAANPRATYGRRVGAGAASAARSVLPDEGVVGCDRINCTYPIDFNPWTLKTTFKILKYLAIKTKTY